MLAAQWEFRFVREADWLAVWILLGAALAWLLYRREGAGIPRALRILMASLRACALALVLALLFEPVMAVLRSRARESSVLVLVDTSRSMGITANEYLDGADAAAAGHWAGLVEKGASYDALPAETRERLKGVTRLATAEGVLKDKGLDLLGKLGAIHQVKRYAFDAGNTPVSGDTLPPADGNATRLGDALRKALADHRGQGVAAVLLLTDGKTNAGEDPEVAAKALADERIPVPVYAIGIGESSPPRDVALGNLAANPVAIKGGDPMTFRARLTATGFEGQRAVVTLFRGDEVADRQEIALPADEQELAVTLSDKPEAEGVFAYRLAAEPLTGELVTENNTLTQTVKVIAERMKVCFLDGRPRWDYRKLKNFLVRNKKFYTSSCLLFSADPSFPQEGSKPIAEFYKDYASLAENVDVLILGDIDPSNLTLPQMESIVRFCEAGGGVVFEAGEESMPGAWRNTPLAKLLPLRSNAENWERKVWLEALTETFTIRLTPQGEDHPLVQMTDAGREENARYWTQLQGQYWFHPIEQLKPLAVPLAVHPVRKTREGEPYPLIVLTRYGAGQSLFLAFDATWRWSYGDASEGAFSRFWGRVIQHMGSNRLLAGTSRAAVSTDRSEYALGDRVFLLARVVDAAFNPLAQDTVKVLVQAPDQTPQTVVLTRNPATGEFEGAYAAGRQGAHEVWLDPASAGGVESRRTPFGVKSVTAEFQEPRMDRQTLERIAQITGGRFYTPKDDLDDLVGRVKTRSEIFTTEERRPIWNSPVVLGILTGLLCLEWILRKWLRLM